MRNIIALFLGVITLCTVQAQTPVPVAQQWHTNVDAPISAVNIPTSTTVNGSAYDWIFSIIQTDKKEYIGCGYSAIATGVNSNTGTTCTALSLERRVVPVYQPPNNWTDFSKQLVFAAPC